MKMTTLMATET